MRVIYILTVCLTLPAFAESEPLGFAYFLQRTIDLDYLPYFDTWDGACKEVTTYDRRGGNMDAQGGMVKDENGVITFLDVKGPGVLCYMYSASPGGIWHFYFDGEAEPRLSIKLTDLYSGTKAPFLAPLAGRRQQSGHSLVPLPFAKRLRVTISKGPGGESPTDVGWGAFHHLMYRQFPEGTPIESFTGQLSDGNEAILRKAVEVASQPGIRPQWRDYPVKRTRWEATLKLGATTVASAENTGIVQTLRVRTPRNMAPALLRSTLIRAYWDGATQPAIDCPLGDFFGNGFAARPYASQAMGLTENGEYYCYFPMPFSDGMRIELVNESDEAIIDLTVQTEYRALDSLPDNTGRFYAQWRRELTHPSIPNKFHAAEMPNLTGDDNYVILATEGRGRYIGCSLNVYNQHYTWWGEGDSMIFIDDDTWPPSHHGTGTEEFFNDGWGIAPGYSLFAGCIMADDLTYTHGEQVVFRHNVGDFIPFQEKIRVTVEHYHANNMENEYSSTAYWYQLKPPPQWPAMPPADKRILNRDVYNRKNHKRVASLRARFRDNPEELKDDKELVFYMMLWLGVAGDPTMLTPYDGYSKDMADVYALLETMKTTPEDQWPDLVMKLFAILEQVSEKGKLGTGSTMQQKQ